MTNAKSGVLYTLDISEHLQWGLCSHLPAKLIAPIILLLENSLAVHLSGHYHIVNTTFQASRLVCASGLWQGYNLWRYLASSYALYCSDTLIIIEYGIYWCKLSCSLYWVSLDGQKCFWHTPYKYFLSINTYNCLKKCYVHNKAIVV